MDCYNNIIQQLTIEHEKLPKTNQIVGNEKEEKKTKDRRESKGRVLAISRQVYRLLNSDVYYVESESSDNIYYYVKYNPSVFEWCSCKDFESNRFRICKHLYSIEFAIRFGTLKDIDKLPSEAKRYGTTTTIVSKSYEENQYDF